MVLDSKMYGMPIFGKIKILNQRIAAFGHALKGWRFFWSDGLHPKIQIIAAASAILLGYFLDLSPTEWALVLLAIGSVLTAEVFNSVVENIMDFSHPNQHPIVGIIKDMAAGGVLISALISLIIGCIIFIPKILIFFQQ
jgi:diacylglycerol kinase